MANYDLLKALNVFFGKRPNLSMLKGKLLLAFKWQLLRKSNICKFKIMLNGSPVAKCNKQTKQTVISGNNNSYEKKNS